MKIKIGNKVFEVSKKELESNPEEVTIEFDGILRSKEEEVSFIENHKKDARKEGVEIEVKKHRETYGFEGRSINNLIEAVSKKALEDAEIEPAEQLKKIQATLSDKETALKNALSKVGEVEKNFSTYKSQATIDKTITSFFPENTILPKEDLKLIIKSKLNFSTDENGIVTVLDAAGNTLKDPTTANPLGAKDVITNFFKDNQAYLKPIQGGGAGSDSTGGQGKTSLEDFMTAQAEKGISPNSEEFNKELQAQVKAGTVEIE